MDAHYHLYAIKKLQDKIATKSVNYILDNNDLMDTLAAQHMKLEDVAVQFQTHLETLSFNQAISTKELLIDAAQNAIVKSPKASKPRLIAFDPKSNALVLATGLERATDSKKRCLNIFSFKKTKQQDFEVQNYRTIAQAKKLKTRLA